MSLPEPVDLYRDRAARSLDRLLAAMGRTP